ncbi:hypothetical protein H310_09381 [Aphanomyces invadans]|uniref:FAR-17a/AIG1-like protein n=1 Tax=Aphanomyces invadans TaxID=157072 RepID=A0A024TTI5_9STRA|nr:hypothetical protein H310_09381 [Aphanomyces invadans]ETV97450.1 hypothetical protein H310_09381 [Aphanomyces invadans]|eukprot:XP_008873659.1 hypothetical protein H310_09381 [Aphanomyces invadans]
MTTTAYIVGAELILATAVSVWVIYFQAPLAHEEYVSSYALRPPPRLIGRLFHFSSLVLFLVVAGADLRQTNGSCLLYYTFWNFVLQTAYWIWALIDPKRTSRARSMFLDLLLPTNMVMVVVVWAILYPLVGDDLNNWISCTQHGGNLVLLLIEFVCSDVRSVPLSTGALVGLWATTYATFAWVVHSFTNVWLYPFLDVDQPWAPLWYLGLLALHIVFFGVVALLAAIKVYIAEHIPVDYDGTSKLLLPRVTPKGSQHRPTT